MATKKFLEVKELANEELQNELKETLVQMNKLKFDHAIKGLDNPMTMREIRRDVARLKTEVRRREVEAMSPEELAQRSKIRKRRKK